MHRGSHGCRSRRGRGGDAEDIVAVRDGLLVDVEELRVRHELASDRRGHDWVEKKRR